VLGISHRLLKPALAAAGAAALAGGLSPAANASAHRWVSTHTQALHLDGTLLGRAPARQRLEISAVLPLRNQAQINRLIESRTVLSHSQVLARFSPRTSTTRTVSRYLKQHGFTDISISGNRLLVSGRATVAEAERAFDTKIDSYRLNGHIVYVNAAAARVPATLSGDVRAVIGLSDVPTGVPKVAAPAAPKLTPGISTPAVPYTGGFTPKAVANAYDDASMQAAKNTTVTVIASGDMTSTIADLRYAEKEFGFSQVPVNVIYDGPEAGIVNDNPLTGNLEWDLDTQYSTMVPKAVKALDIYDVGTFTDSEVARGINLFVSQDRANLLSASLGECDYIAFLDGAMLTTDEVLAQGALQGQSMFASTGDNGYACPEVVSSGVPEGPPGVSWPSDGYYTTGVGGTTLLADQNGNVEDEIAWIGGGGGVSPWESAPPWTLQANGAGQSWQYTNQGGRSVPDVSAVADENTPVLVYDSTSGSPTGVGGTSVASPVTMGLFASVQSVHRNSLGLASYDFYSLYNKVNPATVESGPLGPTYVPAANPSPVTGFRDITLGTNGGCVARAGYDYCSGIGSLQSAALSGAL
jgi:subtilase family serine protease